MGIQETETDKYLPNFINLETPVHCIIYDKKLPYESCKLYTNFPKEVKKFSLPATIPPNVNKLDPMHGFTKQNWYDSLFWSIISQMVLYNYKIPTSVNELRKLATTELKKGILAIKLKDSIFNNVHSDYRTYLQELGNGAHQVDQDLLLVHTLAQALHHCIIIIYDNKEKAGKSEQIIRFNSESTKPPLIFGLTFIIKI